MVFGCFLFTLYKALSLAFFMQRIYNLGEMAKDTVPYQAVELADYCSKSSKTLTLERIMIYSYTAEYTSFLHKQITDYIYCKKCNYITIGVRKDVRFMMPDPNVERKDNIIILNRLNHPKCVSDFIHSIRDCISRGYKDIRISSTAQTIYPNACVPISGIIQHYVDKDISFAFDLDEASYLCGSHFSQPLFFPDDADLDAAYAYPLDKIFKFDSYRQVAKLSQAYVDFISHLAVCEHGVIDSISWCISEVMDNVLTHSASKEGYVMAQFHPSTRHVAFCVYDAGIGIYNSLKQSKHRPQSEIDALTLAIQEGVGDGKGQGNGLYGLYASVLKNKGILSLTSGGSSIMLTSAGAINKFDRVPYLSATEKSTIVDFQIKLDSAIDFSTIFSSIGQYEVFDSRIDDMLSETDEFIHYNVFENSQGTGTREAGAKLRNDVINIFRREKRVVILDFSQVQTVSSSFIDEFIAKLVLHFGFVAFNKYIRIVNMNENVTLLCERSFYMRVSDEWQNRKPT